MPSPFFRLDDLMAKYRPQQRSLFGGLSGGTSSTAPFAPGTMPGGLRMPYSDMAERIDPEREGAR